MKRCDPCLKPDKTLMHPETVRCHWLDGDTICPHCKGPLVYFRGSPFGDLMDEMSMDPDAFEGSRDNEAP